MPADRRSRRRAGPGPDAHDPELDSYLAALAPGGEQHPTELTGRFGSAQVFAEERGVSPGALAVDWVIDRLDREDTPTGPIAVVAEAEQRRRGPLSRLRRSKDGS